MSQNVVVVGSANQDIVVQVDRIPQVGETILGPSVSYLPGGKGLNQSCAAASSGARTYFVGALGRDPAGDQLEEALENAEVNTNLTSRLVGEPSGTAHILVSSDGGNQIVVVPSANWHVSQELVAEALDQIPGSPVLVLQGEIPMESNYRAAKIVSDRGGQVVFNLAPAEKADDRLMELASPLVVNEFEAGLVLNELAPTDVKSAFEALEKLLQKSPKVIITLGASGAVVGSKGRQEHIPAPKVANVVDTTGAGDAFVGVLAAQLAKDIDLFEAVEIATLAAAATVSHPGASSSYAAIKGSLKL